MPAKWVCQGKPGYFSRFETVKNVSLEPVNFAVFSRRFSGFNLKKCSGY